MITHEKLKEYDSQSVREPGYLGRPCGSCSKKLKVEEPTYFMGRTGACASIYLCERCWFATAGKEFMIETVEEYREKGSAKTSPLFETKSGKLWHKNAKNQEWQTVYVGEFIKPERFVEAELEHPVEYFSDALKVKKP